MRLEHPAAVLQGGSGPLVHHAPCPPLSPFDPHRINPIGREQLPGRQLAQVNGGDAKLAAELLAFLDPADDAVGPAQHGASVGEISTGNRPADPATGDRLSAKIDRLNHVHVEAKARPKHPERLDVPAAAAAETMVVSNHEFAYCAALQQDLANE